MKQRQKILFSHFNSVVSSAMKGKAWDEVQREVLAVGVGRSAAEVKKKWCQVCIDYVNFYFIYILSF